MKKVVQVLCVFLMLCPLFLPIQVEGKTVKDLMNELNALEEKNNQNNSEKAMTQEQINKTNQNMKDINAKIADAKKQVEDLTIEIQKLNKEIKEKDAEIKKLVNFVQVSNGESAYLEYAFGAQDFTDFIYRMAISEQLANYNKKLMNDYNQMIQDNKKKQEDLKTQQVVLKEEEAKLNVELAKLGEKMTTLSDTSISLAEDIKLQKEIVQMYKDLGCEDNDDISSCGRSKLPPGTSFLRPIVTGHVNSEWGSRWGGFHEGMDMTVSPNGNVPVYASSSGIVAAIRVKQPCGGNMVLIHHNINGKTYTSMYAHLRRITVSKGQRVNQNTQVGVMGGNPSIETWDSCSSGPHMHFTISTGLYATDYTSWDTLIKRSINPRSVCNFPALGRTFKDRSTKY